MYQVCVSQGYGVMPEDIANNKKLILQHWTPHGALIVTHGAEAVILILNKIPKVAENTVVGCEVQA